MNLYRKLKTELEGLDTHILFGIIMAINYPLYYFLFDYAKADALPILLLRLAASLICLPLIVKNYWPQNIRKSFNIYWYMTVGYCLGFFFTFMLLLEHFSTIWLMNSLTAVFFMLIILDIKMFMIIQTISTIIAYIFYTVILDQPLILDIMSPSNLVSIYGAAIILGGSFAYSREMYYSRINTVKNYNKLLEIMVNEKTIELSEALAVKTKILHNTSHEIRLPTHGMKGISGGLVKKWEYLNDEQKLNMVKDISINAERLSNFINNILDVSKFEAGKMVFDFHVQDIIPVIKDMIDECNSLHIDNKDIVIKFNYADTRNTVANIDSDRIAQLLRNLLGNAIRYTEQGVIQIVVSNEGDNIIVSIIDSGIGIPESECVKIFEPFVQSTHTESLAGGTGLGLTICKEIIDAHGGGISAENNISSKGAKFSFTLPTCK